MKFAHLADCHMGSWRDPKMRDVNTKAFIKTVDTCVSKEVDFVLISGDLFNTPLPALDNLKSTVTKLKELKDKGIPVYILAGSHDFSPSGRTMIDVLEEAGLVVNVVKGEVVDEKLELKFTVDPKTGIKITGMLGKKGSLEKSYYENLNFDVLEKEEGYKIFMFHSALTEFKPEDMKDMESHPLSLLPKGFNYYAGGHVHYVFEKKEPDYGLITYPGPIFPNNFAELEKLGRGGFYIVEVNDKNETNIEQYPIQVYNVNPITINCLNKTPEQVMQDVNNEISDKEYNNTIVLLRLSGTLSTGKPSDIDFKEIYGQLYDKSAYFVMRNTHKLQSKDYDEIKIDVKSVDDIEEGLIKEHIGQIKVKGLSDEKEIEMTKSIINVFSQDKGDLKKYDYEQKIKEEINKIIGVD